MNKAAFVVALAEKTGLTKKDVEKVLAAYDEVIVDTLKKGDKVALAGFGTWEVRNRAARMGVNPHTREAIKIKASKTVSFKPGAAVKAAVSGKK